MIIKVDGRTMLKCTKCKQEKEESEFYNNKTMKRGKTYWCKVCSNIQSNLVGKETKAKWASRTYFKRKKEQPEYYLWRNCKHRAKEENWEFNLKVSDIKIPKKCPYLGVSLNTKERQFSPSVDRVVSTKGYVKDNIRVISYKANRMKSNATIEELVAFARGVLEVHAKGVTGCDH